MALVDRPYFKHGDYPLAAELNKLGSNDTEFNSIIDPNVFGARYGSRITYSHSFRYLWFKGTGTIVDLSDSGNTVSLSDDGVPTQYDLDSVDWMSYGKLYQAINLDFSLESNT